MNVKKMLTTGHAGALLLAASGFMTLAATGPEKPTLRGQVVDSAGRPVEGARVCASPTCAASGADGAVILPGVAYGVTRVSVSAEGYASIEGESMLLTPAGGPRTWVLSPAGALAGSLVDSSGRGVGSAKVRLLDRLRGRTVEGSTDAEGAFRIGGLAAGFWRMEIEPVEHLSLMRDSILVDPPVTTNLGALGTRAGSSVAGKIVGPDGSPAAGAEIRVLEAAGAQRTLRSATSDESGLFRVSGLPPDGTVDLLVRPRQGSPRAFRGLSPGAIDGVFPVEGALRVRGTVSVEGKPIPAGTQVSVSLKRTHPAFEANSGIARTAPVDLATGAFTVDNVAVGGEVEVRVFAPGLPGATATVSVASDQDAGPVELAIRRQEPGIRGRVLDREGKPVAGARIGTATSDSEGRFVLDTLEPGQNRFVVTHPSFAPLTHEFAAGGVGERETIVVLEPGGTVEGSVTDFRGRPLVGVRVSAEWPGASTTTGVGGRYRIDNVPLGEAAVQRQGTGISGDFERRRITTTAGVAKQLDFRIGSATIEGTLTRAGLPLAGATLSVTQSFDGKRPARPQEYLYQTTSSDENGSFRLAGLATGPATLVLGFGKQSLTLPVDVPDTTLRLDLELPPFALRGVVLDASGKPLEGACVATEVLRASHTRTRTDAEGRFLLFTEKEVPGMLTVCTCGVGCQELAVEPVAQDEPVILWFAPQAQEIDATAQD